MTTLPRDRSLNNTAFKGMRSLAPESSLGSTQPSGTSPRQWAAPVYWLPVSTFAIVWKWLCFYGQKQISIVDKKF